MSTVLDAPPLAGSRESVRRLLDDNLPDDLAGTTVVVDFGDLLAATVSFADELVRQILVVRNAALLHATAVGDEEFANYLRSRAAHNQVADRLQIN